MIERCRPSNTATLRTQWVDRLVLRPTTDPLDAGEQQKIPLRTADGQALDRFVHAKGPLTANTPPPALLVLKLPGTAGRAERSTPLPANFFRELDSEVWTWNPPGYGGSSGKATLLNLPQAALQFFDQTVSQRSNPQTIVWVFGNSLGCSSALYLASQRSRISGLILRNPPPLQQTIAHVARLGRPRLLHPWLDRFSVWLGRGIPPALDALQTAPLALVPAVFLSAQMDTLVPPALQTQIFNAYAGPKQMVRWRDMLHDDLPDETHLEQFANATDWLLRQVRDRGADLKS